MFYLVLFLSWIQNTKAYIQSENFFQNWKTYVFINLLDDENQIQPYNSTPLKKSADIAQNLETSHETDKKTEPNPDNYARDNNHDTCAPDELHIPQTDKSPRERKVIREPNASNTKENGVIPDIVTEMKKRTDKNTKED